jgi:hypothetical protein
VSNAKRRINRTDLSNLVGNLRGEVGEVITSWTLLRHLKAEAAKLRSHDIAADMQNRPLTTLEVLSGKLEDEIVARLSELAQPKIGQLTFFFASIKLDAFDEDVAGFQRFVRSNGIEEKRNLDVSHKALPETFGEHRHRHIPYRTLLDGVARAVRLMKLIDQRVLGPSAPYFWHEMRRKRYQPMAPPSAGYLIMPYMRLSDAVRARIIQEEVAEGRSVWTEMETVVDGVPANVLAAKEWGGLLIGRSLIMLDHYPIQALQRIDTTAPESPDA